MDYPPFAYKKNGELTGIGKDVADGMTNLCPNLHINVVQVDWEDCWSSKNGGQLGRAVANGTLDGCMTYTHARGRRDELAEWSDAIMKPNPAGLLTLLDESGHPLVDGMDDLEGRTIIDVGGWAPTGDTFPYVNNKCTHEKYSTNVDIIVATGDSSDDNNNDVAMEMLRRGEGDAIYIYANQAGKRWNSSPRPILLQHRVLHLWVNIRNKGRLTIASSSLHIYLITINRKCTIWNCIVLFRS